MSKGNPIELNCTLIQPHTCLLVPGVLCTMQLQHGGPASLRPRQARARLQQVFHVPSDAFYHRPACRPLVVPAEYSALTRFAV